MTAETSPEWLPAGWTLQFKFQKTGRKITHYVNLVTGQKFFTKDDLIHYTKMESKKCDDKLPTLRKIKMPSANGLVNTVVKSNEHPEWLPKNWFMEVKANKSGAEIGKHYKIYVDPSTGFRFYSKPEVLRFLNHAERKSRKPKQKKRALHSRRKVVIEKSTVDDLPSGWIKEVKIKRNANGLRRDPYYTDPASGYVFRSKKSVLRYLETGEISRDAFLPKKHNDDQTLITEEESTAVKANERPEWLPKNWFMEVKAHKSGSKIGKHYKIYVDPSTGFKFYSKPEVFRFLNHAEQKSRKSKQKKRASHSRRKVVIEKSTMDDLPSGWIKEVKIKRNANGLRRDPQLPAAKRQKVKHPATRRQLFTGEETCDRSILSDLEAETFEKVQTKKDYAETGLVTASILSIPQGKGLVENSIKRNPEISEKSSWSSLVAPKASQRKQGKIVSADNVLVSTAAADVLQVKNLLESGTEKRSSIKSKNSGKSKNHKELALPHGFSNRLARLESGQNGLEHVKTCQNKAMGLYVLEDEAPLQLNVCSDAEVAIPCEDAANGGLVSTPASDVLQEKNLGKTRIESERSNIETKNSSKFKKMKELDFSRRSSKRLAGLEPELVGSGVSTEVTLQNLTTKSGKNKAKPPCVLVDNTTRQLNVGSTTKLPNQASAAVNPEINNGRPHEDGIILGERSQMLGTQKGSDSKPELQPFFCSDPCLEFAIKTLTGAIPLEDAINEGLVSTPIVNIQQQKNLVETRIEHNSSRKTFSSSIRSKKRDGSLHHRSSKRLAGNSPELVVNSSSNEQVPNIAARKSHNSKAIRNVDLTSANLTEKLCQQLEIEPRMALEPKLFTLSHVESSNNSKESHKTQTIPIKRNNESPGLQSAIPFGNSWSDPCFELAFKTVRGSSPAEDSFAFQSYSHQQFGSSGLQSAIPFGNSWSDPCFELAFKTVRGSSPAEDSFAFQSFSHQQFGSSGTQRDGESALPHCGLPNVSQNDISSHLDATAQPGRRQQFPLNPPFLPTGNVSLASCSKIGAQQPYRKGKRNYQAK